MSRYANPQSLITTKELSTKLDRPGLCVIDATYYMPAQKKSGYDEYLKAHIPDAIFFDIDKIADQKTDLPHMLPSAAEFADHMRNLGIGNEMDIVIYDQHGMMSAVRAWWMMRIFGAKNIAILDGGLPKWKAEGRPVTTGPVTRPPVNFTASFDPSQLRTKEEIRTNLKTHYDQILDARSAGRFHGTDPEVWPGRRSGHIPGSKNLPYGELLHPENATFKSTDALKALFTKAGIDLEKPVVTTCGSGITACVLAFGLHLIGVKNIAVYDGAWAEWGLPGDTPVEC